jgi:hypothetical protein
MSPQKNERQLLQIVGLSSIKHFNLLVASLALFGGLSSSFASLPDKWKLINEEADIKVYSHALEGTKIKTFRGEKLMNAPLKKILWVLLDNDHRTEWVDRLKYSHVIQTITPFEYIIHQEFNLPWPVANRDYVYKGKATLDSKTGSVTLKLTSVNHDQVPNVKRVVRGHLDESFYVLTPMKDGQTLVEVSIQTDPKGLIPSWLANLIQKKWPIKTLKGIEHQLVKVEKESPLPSPTL